MVFREGRTESSQELVAPNGRVTPRNAEGLTLYFTFLPCAWLRFIGPEVLRSKRCGVLHALRLYPLHLWA